MNIGHIQHPNREMTCNDRRVRFGQETDPLMIRLQKKLEADQAALAKQKPQEIAQKVFVQVSGIGDLTGQDLLVFIDSLTQEQRQKKEIAQSKRSFIGRIKDQIQSRIRPFPDPQGIPIGEFLRYFHNDEVRQVEQGLRELKRYQLIQQNNQLPHRKAREQVTFVDITESGKKWVTEPAQLELFKKRERLERRLKQWFENFSDQGQKHPVPLADHTEVLKELLLRSKIKTASGEFTYGEILSAIEQMSEKNGVSEGRIMQFYQRNLQEELEIEKALLKLQQFQFIAKKELPIKSGVPIKTTFYQITPEGQNALSAISNSIEST